MHQIPVRFCLIAAAVLLIFVGSHSVVYAQDSPGGKIIPDPNGGTYHMAMVAESKLRWQQTVDDYIADVNWFGQSVGKELMALQIDESWDDGIDFPAADYQRIWDAGYVPYVRMMPWSTVQYGETIGTQFTGRRTRLSSAMIGRSSHRARHLSTLSSTSGGRANVERQGVTVSMPVGLS